MGGSPTWPITPIAFVGNDIAGGMSGGPITSLDGRVVGIIHGRVCATSVISGFAQIDAFVAAHPRGL